MVHVGRGKLPRRVLRSVSSSSGGIRPARLTVSGLRLTLMPLASAVEALKVDFWFTPRVYLENKVYFTLAGFGH